MKLGQGIFSWIGGERRSNRYGFVCLDTVDFNNTTKVTVEFDEAAAAGLESKRVKLSAKVIETRDSGHVGDLSLNIIPERPEVGEIVELGVGNFVVNPPAWDEASTQVGLMPEDGRQQLWIDPRRLYRLHDQTVELLAEETQEAFSPDPLKELGEVKQEAISVGGGALQFKTLDNPLSESSVRVLPVFERLGDGLFSITSPGGTPAGTKLKIEIEG